MGDQGDPAARLERLVDGYEQDMRTRPPVDEREEVEAPMAEMHGNRLADLDPTLAELGDAPRTEPVAAATVGPERATTATGEPQPAAVGPSAVEPEDLATWWSRGQRVPLTAGGRTYHVFVRTLGEGPWLTAIHGFPTSSWDWEPISRTLRATHRLLAPDLVGFGDTDKPTGHDWSAFEQADMIESLWRENGITETRVVAHDVGLTVALELLARQGEKRLAARITDFTLMNGGVYSGFHRPRRIQVLLQKPVLGAVIARLLSERAFSRAFAEIFSPAHQPSPEELHQHWLSVARRKGSRNYHHLIRYIPERRAYAGRWEGALERTETPIRFVWGMADPVSGAHMADVIRQRRPNADIVELADVGHYPQLEAPDRVIDAILTR